MKYRQLLRLLQALPEEKLDLDALIYDMNTGDYSSVTRFDINGTVAIVVEDYDGDHWLD